MWAYPTISSSGAWYTSGPTTTNSCNNGRDNSSDKNGGAIGVCHALGVQWYLVSAEEHTKYCNNMNGNCNVGGGYWGERNNQYGMTSTRMVSGTSSSHINSNLIYNASGCISYWSTITMTGSPGGTYNSNVWGVNKIICALATSPPRSSTKTASCSCSTFTAR